MLIRWKNKDKDKEKCEKGSSQKQNSTMGTSKKKRKFGRDGGMYLFLYSCPWVLCFLCYGSKTIIPELPKLIFTMTPFKIVIFLATPPPP
nr:unnamed protein product [Callosobruchus analis]